MSGKGQGHAEPKGVLLMAPKLFKYRGLAWPSQKVIRRKVCLLGYLFIYFIFKKGRKAQGAKVNEVVNLYLYAGAESGVLV